MSLLLGRLLLLEQDFKNVFPDDFAPCLLLHRVEPLLFFENGLFFHFEHLFHVWFHLLDAQLYSIRELLYKFLRGFNRILLNVKLFKRSQLVKLVQLVNICYLIITNQKHLKQTGVHELRNPLELVARNVYPF